ncbi:MAG: NADP-dependent malic enzyme [Solitalea-like symbiont of Tyrophagus putrescentiae]
MENRNKAINNYENLVQDALKYHSKGRPGKISVVPTKSTSSQRDLSLAYSPGVAEPCKQIAKNKQDVYKYTAKGNLVAVISNGTAVLGLGNIGPEASKPVMEGKAVLFKIFADIDVFDIELNATTVEEFINAVKALEPTFGGINLEDIKSPECFEIERRLKEELSIPVMHDDQHGTAIISGAALINALEIQKKNIESAKFVVLGAGAAAISCTRLYKLLGAKAENIIMIDSQGVIRADRENLSDLKKEFATTKNIYTLEEAMDGADIFIGLSKANTLTESTLQRMALNAIVFAMANPDPEIAYEKAISVRPDIIMATGRSDYPNQVNNVLGFPFIFRGALDVRATGINEDMKLAAVKAIASLAKLAVPEAVLQAYNASSITFNKEYIIPKPLDHRLITYVAPAVAKAAIDSGVAQKIIEDWDEYIDSLNTRLGIEPQIIRSFNMRAKTNPKQIIFPDAANYKIIKAARIIVDEGIAKPILIGNENDIQEINAKYSIGLNNVQIIDTKNNTALIDKYAQDLYESRQRKGISLQEAHLLMKHNQDYFAASMLKNDPDAIVITGASKNYKKSIKPYLQIVGVDEKSNLLTGIYILLTKKEPIFLADVSVNLDPTPIQLAGITVLVNDFVKSLNIAPRIALLSHSNFGSNTNPYSIKVSDTIKILHKDHPDILVDGELQAHFAINQTLLKENFAFSKLAETGANVFVFPNLDAGNISYNLIKEISGTDSIGPILTGMNKPVHVLQFGCSMREIVHMATVAVVSAQSK